MRGLFCTGMSGSSGVLNMPTDRAKAVQTLHELLHSDDERVRLRAAELILDAAGATGHGRYKITHESPEIDDIEDTGNEQ